MAEEPEIPSGAVYQLLEIPTTVVSSSHPLLGPAGLMGVVLEVTGFGGTRSWLDGDLSALRVDELSVSRLTVPVPLPGTAEEAESLRETFDVIVEDGISLTIRVRRDLRTERPYDTVALSHAQGTLEVFYGPRP